MSFESCVTDALKAGRITEEQAKNLKNRADQLEMQSENRKLFKKALIAHSRINTN
jgi:hypothetical protein